LKTDLQFFYETPEALLSGYRDICKRIDPELIRFFGKLPRTPYGVKAIPDYSAPAATTAYYSRGSVEAARPGYYYANTYDLKSRPKWEMEALSIHEAVPGHHLQISLAQEMEDLPRFRQNSGFTAFVEGWALYCESLGEDLGLYQNPYSKFGQLTYEMWRAIRLVVDTGIHSKGWSREQAMTYFQENSAKTDHDIQVEVDRYIAWPGQALAYKIGELKIKELRVLAEKELGDAFDIRDFHDTLLADGALPLDVLEEKMKDWIAHEKSAMSSKDDSSE
jgi:prolyl oligopeptidase